MLDKEFQNCRDIMHSHFYLSDVGVEFNGQVMHLDL